MPTTGTTPQRGYGAAHRRERARWQRRLDRGERIACHSTRCLHPGVPVPRDPAGWDLGHTADRTTWTGPEHRDCNRAEGGARGNAAQGRTSAAEPHSRRW